MTTQDYFDELGAALETGWAALGRDEEAFPRLAERVLTERPPTFDKDAFIRERLDPRAPARRQLAPPGTFGQPAFTVFHGHGFLIDVYFWVNSLSAIHNHPFCGLFTVLDGFSVHAVYRFDERERLGPRTRIGDLRQMELSLVEAGEHRLFSLGDHPLVHALIHVPVGAVSMVIRTARTRGYLRYLPPSLAFALEPPDEIVERRTTLLETLRHAHHPTFVEHLVTFLGGTDLEGAFIALSPLWTACNAEERSFLLETLRARFGDRADLLPPTLERSARWLAANQLRERLHDQEARFVATVLMLAETRADALALLGRRHDDPIGRLHRFVDESMSFAPDDPAAPVLAHALVDGVDPRGAEQRLIERFGSESVASGQLEVIAEHQRTSLLSALDPSEREA